MPRFIEKVTTFVSRKAGRDLLLFEHPNAGVQIPAGTVEDNETPEEVALREAAEETGLTSLSTRLYLGYREETLPEGQKVIVKRTKVYARPDEASFDWAFLRKGIRVTVDRRSAGFSQVSYEEFDRVLDPQYVTMHITGWVPNGALAEAVKRHFFHLEFCGSSEERWTVFTDNHCFTLFWAPLTALPRIIHPQDTWLELLFRS